MEGFSTAYDRLPRSFRKLVWTGLVLWLSMLMVAFCCASEPLNALVPERFVESLVTRVPVSGTVLVGVQFADSTMPSPDVLWTYLPYKTSDRLCVSALSDDGRYSGTAEYPLKGKGIGQLTLSFPTLRKTELASYGTKRVALLGVLARDCAAPDSGGGSSVYLPLGWVEPPTRRISILVNASDTDARLFDSSTHTYSDCSIRKNQANVAFDNECTITLPDAVHEWHGFLLRSHFQNPLPQVPLRIQSR